MYYDLYDHLIVFHNKLINHLFSSGIVHLFSLLFPVMLQHADVPILWQSSSVSQEANTL